MPTPRWPPRPTASPSGTRSSPPDRGVPSSPAPQGRERATGMLKSRGCEARARVTATRPPAASRSPNSRGSAMPHLAKRMGRAKPSANMVVAEKAKQLKAEDRDIISFRSEGRRVGKECVSTCKFRYEPDHQKKHIGTINTYTHYKT